MTTQVRQTRPSSVSVTRRKLLFVRNGEKPLEKINLFIYLCTICMQTESIASKLLFALICVDGN